MVERDSRWPADAPADHLDTVEYWRDLYGDAIKVGQEMLTEARAETERLRAAIRLHRDSVEVGRFFDQRLWSVLNESHTGRAD